MLRRLRQKGGKVVLSHPEPEVSAVSSTSAIKNAISTQNEMNSEMAKLNQEMAGGGEGIVVPQLDQAGPGGNSIIAGAIANGNQANADAEFDGGVIDPDKVSINNGMPGGGKKKKRKRRKKRKTRKMKGGHHLYKRLGVSKYASKKSIKKAYKKLKKQKKLTKKIKYAYKILSNNRTRKAYNKKYRK